jgi:hypothetical protein
MRGEVGDGVGGIVLFRWHWIPCCCCIWTLWGVFSEGIEVMI